MKIICASLRLVFLIGFLLSAANALPAQSSAGHPPPDTRAAAQIASINDLNVPESAKRNFEKGRALFLGKHKTEESILFLRKAIRQAPSFSLAHFLLGTVYMDSAKWPDAESELRMAISLNDKFGFAYLALGSCLFEQGRFDEAEEPLSRSNELNPGISQGNYELARTYYALGRYQEAQINARKSLALAPSFAEGHMVLGHALLRLHENQAAFDEFQTYVRLAPESPMARQAKDMMNELAQVLTAMH